MFRIKKKEREKQINLIHPRAAFLLFFQSSFFLHNLFTV